jgi:hypothetical protein
VSQNRERRLPTREVPIEGEPADAVALAEATANCREHKPAEAFH